PPNPHIIERPDAFGGTESGGITETLPNECVSFVIGTESDLDMVYVQPEGAVKRLVAVGCPYPLGTYKGPVRITPKRTVRTMQSLKCGLKLEAVAVEPDAELARAPGMKTFQRPLSDISAGEQTIFDIPVPG